MELEISQIKNIARIEIKGQVDERGAEDLKAGIVELDLPSLKEVVFDFKDVSRIGSAGIGQMLLLYKNLAVGGGRIRVERVSGTLFELFQGLKLDTLFTISRG